MELDESTVVDGLVNITTDNARTQERFPDLPTQVAGCILDRAGRLAYLRWAPSKSYPNVWIREDGGGGRLHYHIPERSHAFLVRAIESTMSQHVTVNVLLLLGGQRYDVGDVRREGVPTADRASFIFLQGARLSVLKLQ